MEEPEKYYMSWDECYKRLDDMKERMAKLVGNQWSPAPTVIKTFGIIRGGAIVSGMLGTAVDHPSLADVLVDDIIDTGHTLNEWSIRYPAKSMFALVDKLHYEEDAKLGWIVFPWENGWEPRTTSLKE